MSRNKNARTGSADICRPTLIEFILDETGSMSSCKDATVAGYNAFVDEQRAEAGKALFTLTKFDTSGLKTPFVDLDLSLVIPMTNETFVPGSSTNLRDAIGVRVRDIETRIASWQDKPHVLVIVMTDGSDNASRSYSEAQVRDLIKAHETDGWTFVFLAACDHGVRIAAELGFQPGNTKVFEKADMTATMTSLSRSTTAYRASLSSADVTSSTTYFAQ